MNLRRWISRTTGLGAAVALAMTLIPGPQAASAAGTTIKASVVNGNAGTLKVTGSGFARRARVTVEFDQNENGAFVQDFTVTSDRYGKINTSQLAYVTGACLVAVTAWDATHTSNTYLLNTFGQGCSGAQVQVNPCGGGCNLADLGINGTGFTPGAQVYVEVDGGALGPVSFTVNACGTLQPGSYPPPPAGELNPSGSQCIGLSPHSDYWCPPFTNNPITVWAEDLSIDYVTPTVTVDTTRLC